MRAGIELVHPYRAAQARSRRPETEEEMEDGARGTEGRIKRRGGRGTIRGRSARPRENGVPWTESRATPRPTVTQQRHAQATTNTKKATRKKHQRSTPPVERGNRKATPEAQAREEEEERWRGGGEEKKERGRRERERRRGGGAAQERSVAAGAAQLKPTQVTQVTEAVCRCECFCARCGPPDPGGHPSNRLPGE